MLEYLLVLDFEATSPDSTGWVFTSNWQALRLTVTYNFYGVRLNVVFEEEYFELRNNRVSGGSCRCNFIASMFRRHIPRIRTAHQRCNRVLHKFDRNYSRYVGKPTQVERRFGSFWRMDGPEEFYSWQLSFCHMWRLGSEPDAPQWSWSSWPKVQQMFETVD